MSVLSSGMLLIGAARSSTSHNDVRFRSTSLCSESNFRGVRKIVSLCRETRSRGPRRGWDYSALAPRPSGAALRALAHPALLRHARRPHSNKHWDTDQRLAERVGLLGSASPLRGRPPGVIPPRFVVSDRRSRSLNLVEARFMVGGEGGIRTHGPREGTPVFKTGAINRSATSPHVNSMTYTTFFASSTRIRRKCYQISSGTSPPHRSRRLPAPLQRAFINLSQRHRKPDGPKLHRGLRARV